MPSEQNGSKRQNLSRKGGSSHKTVDSFFLLVCLLLANFHAYEEACEENAKYF